MAAAETVAKVINPKNSASEVMDIYNDWATKYDENLPLVLDIYKDMASNDFNGPRVAFECLQKVVSDQNARILDIGAGTGGLGVCLKDAGYTNVDALDPNQAMLDVAKKRNVYKNFIVDFLTSKKLDVQNDTYDAIIGSGLFVPGHVTEDCFDELCRITKSGGRIVILSSRRYYEAEFDGYGQKLAAAILNQESRGLWKIEKQEEVAYHGPYKACISYVIVQ